ncbi:cytochrome P450 [Macrolepiota fuliginosa MF-IS2]|uniref:Cytochrome P450 n=1 Tax=Macrolepiota fuliginosa MF-IS2 TaxID=1400762 RepID=A0A9P5X8G6_9AGAR|nr:cytochrome P450 [Macrolepiota fuliginosa MF-IS2]
MSLDQQITWLALLSLAVVTISVALKSRKSSLPYPPGPKRLPLLGNLLDLPKTTEWETYTKWSKEYDSDIIYINLAGTHVLVLNTLKAALDLLNKRSAKYSSRAPFVMANELVGWEWLPGGMAYGKRWRARRRLVQQHFDPANPSMYQHWQLHYAKNLLLNMLGTPEKTWDHVSHMVAGAIISIAYGIEVQPKDDPYVKLAVEGSHSLIDTMVPGKYLVDSLPFLKHLPDWFPGAGFKREANKYKEVTARFRKEPFLATVDAMNKGIAQPSFVSQCLQAISENTTNSDQAKEERIATMDMAANIYLGGADTTMSGIGMFLLAMVSYPQVQKKAHEELDRVLGHGRLPEFADKDSLPYLDAIVKEVFRWKPTTPIGVPHYSTEDDEYRGYYIPKNTLVIGNARAILHDEKTYPQPEKFLPERFLTKEGNINPDIQDPSVAAFGFGRRECPGKHVGISATWLIAAYILSAFTLNKPTDPITGEIIEPGTANHSGLVTPMPFSPKITPRSGKAIEMIRMLGR